MLTLRPYQQEAITTIRKEFEFCDRQYIVMPTGSGKTVTFLSYAKQFHKRILIVVPSRQLLKQVYESCLLFYHNKDISRRGDDYLQAISTVHICVINSAIGDHLKDLFRVHFDLIIIDEAHHSHSDSYKKLINSKMGSVEEGHVKILGVTATPDRSDGRLLFEILGQPTYVVEVKDLIHQKYLSDIEGLAVRTNIDLSDVDDHNGDFSLKFLYNKLNVESRNTLILNAFVREMVGRKTLVFCINVLHSKQLCSLFSKNGISCAHIDGKMTSLQKQNIIDGFKSGHISVIFNCHLLTEGFDEPSINGIILARPTQSRSLFLQMLGRGLRIYPGKNNCKVVDIVDSHRKVMGFSSIGSSRIVKAMDKFNSMNEIEDFVEKELLILSDFRMEKVDLLGARLIDEKEATPCMIAYLNKNNITYLDIPSFEEAAFLIWMNKLELEYKNGKHS